MTLPCDTSLASLLLLALASDPPHILRIRLHSVTFAQGSLANGTLCAGFSHLGGLDLFPLSSPQICGYSDLLSLPQTARPDLPQSRTLLPLPCYLMPTMEPLITQNLSDSLLGVPFEQKRELLKPTIERLYVHKN
ncbi:hypothetical protein N7G274_004484 [Stereocaulon virgatum]|uniref:Uncharacterized protein n=1 Tax=Stereocaulon virgatum TaxID=373712 RepID=A0ABR4AAD3_9LECA